MILPERLDRHRESCSGPCVGRFSLDIIFVPYIGFDRPDSATEIGASVVSQALSRAKTLQAVTPSGLGVYAY